MIHVLKHKLNCGIGVFLHEKKLCFFTNIIEKKPIQVMMMNASFLILRFLNKIFVVKFKAFSMTIYKYLS